MIVVVDATWDQEANVWVATSHDVPGLATEAETLEALSKKLEHMVLELLEANGAENKDVNVLVRPDKHIITRTNTK